MTTNQSTEKPTPYQHKYDPLRPSALRLSGGIAEAKRRAESETQSLGLKIEETRKKLDALLVEQAELGDFLALVTRLADTGPRSDTDRSGVYFVRSFTSGLAWRKSNGSAGSIAHVEALRLFYRIGGLTTPVARAGERRSDAGGWGDVATHRCPCCGRLANVVAAVDDSTHLGLEEVTTLKTMCFSCSRACAFGEHGRGEGYIFSEPE